MSDSSSSNDWELVTPGTLSSHSSLASGSASGAPADGGAGIVDSNVGSGYFVYNSPTSTSQEPTSEFLSSDGRTEQFAAVTTNPTCVTTPEVPSEVLSADVTLNSAEGKQVEEMEFESRGILMSESCHELSKFHWMEEPRLAGHQLLEFEGSGLGSTSNPDAYASEIKAELEPDSQPVGPLLGSCMSAAPYSPSIVSRDNLLLLNISDEMVGEVLGGSATSQRGCLTEVEPDTVTSVEHEKLLAHSAFISSDDSVAAVQKMGVTLEEERSAAPAVENERASEIWCTKQAALRGVRGRQAGTYWSIALAAAVMGLIILGHRWQYERRQSQQLRLRLCVKEEKIGELSLQLARMKEVLSGRRRVPVLRSNSYFNGSTNRY